MYNARMRLIVFATLLMGCAQPAARPTPTPKQEEAPPPPAPASAPAVTVDSVAGLTADTEVNEAALRRLFAGYQVTAATRQSEGQEVTVYELRRDGALSVVVEPTSEGKVYRVGIVDPDATTPVGIRVGAGYADLEKALPEHECFRLVEERADSVACYGAEASSIGYVLGGAGIEGFRGPPGTVPKPAVLRKATITEILWLPESQ